jgi:hypothetical protein
MASLRLIAMTLIGVFVLSILGCSSDSGSGSGNGGNERKLSPSERWPETGDFRYNFNESINGASCRASDFFYRKADYCIALTDREKNSGCALDSRRRTYTTNCGSDFEETNIKGKDWFGWDDRLDTSCSTPHVFDNFPTLATYCAFLKDESKHLSCHWDDRRHEFARNQCAGPFSPEPGSPSEKHPAPSPTPEATTTPIPEPTATPEPSPTPDSRPQVARDLEAAGITVTVDYNSYIPRDPGQPDFRDQVAQFWKVLENVKANLIARRQALKEIRLTEYTVYNAKYNYLSLDVSLTEGEIIGYLNLLDRRLAMQTKLGFPLDLGIEIYGHELGDKTKDLRATLDTLDAYLPELMKVKSTLRGLNIHDYFNYSFYMRELQIKKQDIHADLTKAIKLLQPMAEFYQFAATLGLGIDIPSYSMDLEIDGPTIGALTKKLMNSQKNLMALKSMNQLDKIQLSKMQTDTTYYQSLKLLSPASVGPNFDALTDVIDSLALSHRLATEIGVEFRTSSSLKLESSFIKAAKRFDKYYKTIKAKKSIKSLYYGKSSSYSYTMLTIGSDDSDAAFEKVLAGIQ